jgi:hypothetical protein
VAEMHLIFRTELNDAAFAFVLWFSPMSRRDPRTRLRKVTKLRSHFGRMGGIVPLSDIASLASLAPDLPGDVTKGSVNPLTSMAMYESFYVNRFGSHALYALLAEE